MTEKTEDLLPLRYNEIINEYLYLHHLTPKELSGPVCLLPEHMSEDRSVIEAYLRGVRKDEHFSRTGVMSEKDVIPEKEKVGIFLHPRFGRLTLHQHDYLEIKYMAMGNIRMPISRNYVTLNEGDFCFILPGTGHYVDIHDRNTLLINFVVRLTDVPDVFRRVTSLNVPLSKFLRKISPVSGYSDDFLICRSRDNPRIRQLVLDCYSQKWDYPDNAVHRLQRESILEQILLELTEEGTEIIPSGKASESQIPPRFFPVLYCIRDQCSTITFADVCRQFHYSEAYLSRMIRKYTGSTFTDLVQKERLQKAARLLLSTDLPVSTIMADCGYRGSTHFYRIFTEQFGLTPALYRKSGGPP